jgi:hypothetical protein
MGMVIFRSNSRHCYSARWIWGLDFPGMIEAEARDLLRQHDGVGGLEVWLADQPWVSAPNGWQVTRDFDGWRFVIQPIGGGLQLVGTAANGGRPAVWAVKSGLGKR